MKKWPKQAGEMVDVGQIFKPLRSAFLKFTPDVDWKKSTQEYTHNWDGLAFAKGVAHIVCQPDEKLRREGLDHELDNGRDVLDTLIQIAVCLGFEQGRRYHENEVGSLKEILKTIEELNKQAKKTIQDAKTTARRRVSAKSTKSGSTGFSRCRS